MWLYKHHTCSDLIDLDHDTGRWRPVDDSEKPPGARVLADLPVRGSYTDVGDKRFYSYWTDDQRFIFRTYDGQVFELCRKLANGTVVESSPGLRCVIEPAKYSDGRLMPGKSSVSLVSSDGKVLYTLAYDSDYYLQLYASDFTAASAVQDLSDWDFFVALKGAIEIFAERATSGRVQLTIEDDGAVVDGRKIQQAELLFADTGKACPRSGVWVCVEDMRHGLTVRAGDAMPALAGRAVQWVWSRER